MLMEMAHRHETSTNRRANKPTVVVQAPDTAIDGVLDVVTLRALMRAFAGLSKTHQERKGAAYRKAMMRVFNINDSLAKAILETKITDGKR